MGVYKQADEKGDDVGGLGLVKTMIIYIGVIALVITGSVITFLFLIPFKRGRQLLSETGGLRS